MRKTLTPKDPDRAALVFALGAAALIMLLQIAGKATRDTLFLAEFEIRHLPKAMILSAFLSVAGVLMVSRATARIGPARVLRIGLLFSAGLFLFEWGLAGPYPRMMSALVYIHVSVVGAILISALWSVLNERFDPYSAKVSFGNVAAAMTFGGVLGGVLAQQVGAGLSVASMLPMLAAISLICLVTLRLILASDRHRQHDSFDDALPLREFLFEAPFFRLMVLLVGTTAVAETLLDYALKAEAASRYAGEQQLIGFFSVFYGAVSLVTFVVQTTLGRRAMGRFGLGVTLAIQPVVMILTGALAAVMLRMWTVVLLRASQSVLANSFFRAAFEQLYTPVPASQKRPSKILIDVGAQRLGDLAGSGLVLIVLLVIPSVATQTVIVMAVVAGCVSLYLMRWLHRGYVAQLARNLRSGVVTLGEEKLIDATTRRTLALTQGGAVGKPARERQPARRRRGRGSLREDQKLVDAIQTIVSGDADAIARKLIERPFDTRLAAPVIPLLSDPKLSLAAEQALRSIAPRIAGQLADAFLDPQTRQEVRVRMPWLLSVTGSALAAKVLVAGLDDEDFAIRYRCGQALSHLTRADNALRLDREHVHELARRELKADSNTWASRDEITRRLRTLPHPGPVGPDEGRLGGLGHVFNLLALVHDANIIKLAVLALRSDDDALRGTALEYLANVLPERLFDRLAVHLRGS